MNRPQRWASVPLGEAVALKTGPFGSSLRKSDYVVGGTPVVNPMHIVKGRIEPSDGSRVGGTVLDRLADFKLENGDVVLGRRGEMGRCAVVQKREAGWLCGTGSMILRPAAFIEPAFLQRYLSSPVVVRRLQGDAVGSTMVNLNQAILRALALPIPPLAEQRRIVEKLDSLLARIDACRQALDRVPAILKRFRRSVLAAAVSGELTSDWRKEQGCVGDWRTASLGDILTDVRYGTAKKCTHEPRATPVLRIPNVTDGIISHEDLKYAEFDNAERAKLELSPGDVLVIRSNGSLGLVGRAAVVTQREAGFLYAGYLIRLRPDAERARPGYLARFLESPGCRSVIEQTARSTTGVNNLNADEIRRLETRVPPLAEQDEIVRRTGDLFAQADLVEQHVERALARLERGVLAVLGKAFRGEIVPQDPNDEPASVMLKRLRADRALDAEAKNAKPRARASSAFESATPARAASKRRRAS